MKKAVPIFTLLLAGCSTTTLVDSEWLIKPSGTTSDYAVEMEEGNLICVVEKDDPSSKSCVPRVHEEQEKDK